MKTGADFIFVGSGAVALTLLGATPQTPLNEILMSSPRENGGGFYISDEKLKYEYKIQQRFNLKRKNSEEKNDGRRT